MSLQRLKAALPWWGKIAIKLLLARLPAGYRLWQRLNLFKHGHMEQPAYAHEVFRKHFERSNFPGKAGGFVCMEIGPGDTLFSALIAHSMGASRTYLIDAGRYARQDLSPYLAMQAYLSNLGRGTQWEEAADLEALLEQCRARYDDQGLSSLDALPDACVDWIWPNAVLEHIRRGEFLPYMRALRRILKPGGVCSHRVDLRDHLGGALNNLRFSERFWERDWVAKSGFYTNRIGLAEMCRLFDQAGFDVEVIAVDRWPSLPTPRNKLDSAFRDRTDEDLCVQDFDVLLRLPAPGTG